MQNIFVRLFISFSILFIHKTYSQQPKTADSLMSIEAKDYFDTAFKLIKSSSYLKKKVDFDRIYTDALPYIKSAKNPIDTYDAIKFVLASLKDRHSVFISPKKNPQLKKKEQTKVFPLKGQFFNGEYAVLQLFSYSSTDLAHHKEIADSIYRFLLCVEKSGIKNLIIDLRNMEGGSNDPFLCGLGPLIDNNHLFTYVGNENQKVKITFENGRLYRIWKKQKVGNIYLSNYSKDNDLASIAISILLGPNTASAGEIIAIPFKGLSNVRFVGAPTYGIPTGVALLTLKDGAAIGIASSVPVDRDGKFYSSPLIPDIFIEMKGLSDKEVYQKIVSIEK